MPCLHRGNKGGGEMSGGGDCADNCYMTYNCPLYDTESRDIYGDCIICIKEDVAFRQQMRERSEHETNR